MTKPVYFTEIIGSSIEALSAQLPPPLNAMKTVQHYLLSNVIIHGVFQDQIFTNTSCTLFSLVRLPEFDPCSEALKKRVPGYEWDLKGKFRFVPTDAP